jgi:hypothetical protein
MTLASKVVKTDTKNNLSLCTKKIMTKYKAQFCYQLVEEGFVVVEDLQIVSLRLLEHQILALK